MNLTNFYKDKKDKKYSSVYFLTGEESLFCKNTKNDLHLPCKYKLSLRNFSKDMINYIVEIDKMDIALEQTNNVSNINSENRGFPNKKQIVWSKENGMNDVGLINFLQSKGAYKFDWKMKNKDQTVKSFGGHLNILPLKSILGDWKKIVYFDFDPADSPKRNFKIVDFFVDEACVGFFLGDEKQLLFYHEFESEFYPLYLDFDGYFAMMLKSKTFWYWQKVLSEINEGISSPTTEHFISCMTELFPEFDFQKYKNDYIRLKLNK